MIGVLAFVQASVEGDRVEAQGLGERLEACLAEASLVVSARLIGEKDIVVFPELVLISSAFGGLSRPLRFLTQKGDMLAD